MQIKIKKIQSPFRTDDDKNQWMLSYSDMVTLLLCFFAMFFAVSQVDTVKFEMISEYFNKTNKTSLYELEKKIKALISEQKMEDVVEVTLTPDGLELNFQDRILFDSGKAKLKSNADPILAALAKILKTDDVKKRVIQIAGHTDTVPIGKTSVYPSNWELSTARSSQVIRYFINKRLNKKRFEAIGYADTRLRKKENSLKRGLAVNRRVILLIK